MIRSRAFPALMLLSIPALVTGCPGGSPDAGVTDSGDDGGVDPNSFDQHGCDHMEYGPPVAVTAASGDDAPMVSTGHRRTDITLVEVGGDNGGTVLLHVDATEPVSLYLDKDVGLAVMQNGATVTPSDNAPNALCPDQVAYRAVFALEEGMAMLTFGPTSEGEVHMVARAAVDDEGGHTHDAGHVHDAGHEHTHDAGHAHDAGHEHTHDAGTEHVHDAGTEHVHDAGHEQMQDAG